MQNLDLQSKKENEKIKEAKKQIGNYKEFFKKLAKKRLTNEDYEKFFLTLGSKELREMGLDPDEIRIKMDQILDWNASDKQPDKTLVKSKVVKAEKMDLIV